jgi:RCC1 and BTB domain-containing protein
MTIFLHFIQSLFPPAGMYGKLGLGNEGGSSVPKRVEALGGVIVAQIACGSRHTVIVTSTGAAYSWGDMENGVAGHGAMDGHQCTPRLLERLATKRIVQVSACGFHTACLSDADELYTWGEGKFGRLGHGNESNCHSPRLVESLLGKKPRQVGCGGFHSAVVTEDGRLYTFGGGEHGQLGHNDRVNKLRPTLVQALEGIFVSHVTCGWSHSVALTAKGRVYSWGNPDHGKLGCGTGRRVSVPQLVDKLKDYRVVRIASYNEHTAALVEPLDHYTAGTHGAAAAAANAVSVSVTYHNQLGNLVNDDEFADVMFLVEHGQAVYAHRAILSQRCDHFAAMFRSGMRESTERTISLPNISKTTFLLLLEYIYTDSVKVDVDEAVDLYMAADLYHLDRLREMCCTVVRRHLNVENFGPLLQAASEVHCQVLKDVCMEFVVANFDAVSKTDGIKQVSHSLLLEILAQR